jgi:hypothetical protein
MAVELTKENMIAASEFDSTGLLHQFLTLAQADGEISCFAHELKQRGEYSRNAIQTHACTLADKLEGNGATAEAEKLRYFYSDDRGNSFFRK